MSDYESIEAVIDAQLARSDLTPEGILQLTIARRLNRVSDSGFAQALGTVNEMKIMRRRLGRA